MFSELTAPANVRRRRVLIGAWLLHAALWLALALFLLLMRRSMADEAALFRLDGSSVIDQVQRQQVQALGRFFIYATVLCLALCAVALFWAWHLLNQRLRAWRLGIAWLGFEYLGLVWVIWQVVSAADPEGAGQPRLAPSPWMIGSLLLQMLAMGAIPFIHLWSRRAYELRPGEHSDALRFKWWLGEQSERLMGRLFKRAEPPAPVADQRPAPPPIPEDIERRQMWPSAPLPPAADSPPDDHFRS